MSDGWFLLLLLIGLVLISGELYARRLIRRLRAEFQWLITEHDEIPVLDQAGLDKFIAGGYDPELGWVRKPNTTGTERGHGCVITWHIDHVGARYDPVMKDAPARVVVMGDSYAFARQVEDIQAWPAQLGQLLGVRVLNFGVGNYGLDQALLRYRRLRHLLESRVVIMGVVPETIVRVHSAWRHYSEYGNTFGFKPRFYLQGQQLELWPNVIATPSDFSHYTDFLPILRDRDHFYKTKFRQDLIRFSYLWHWLTKPRNRRLVALLTKRQRQRTTGDCDARCEAAPFRSVMARNIRLAGSLYDIPECRRLLAALITQFASEVCVTGAVPVLVMLPQLLDLECFGCDGQPYRALFAGLIPNIRIVDTAEFLYNADWSVLYVEDSYGGHFSAQGNSFIARHLAQYIEPLLSA